jgi:hypothetical protein
VLNAEVERAPDLVYPAVYVLVHQTTVRYAIDPREKQMLQP